MKLRTRLTVGTVLVLVSALLLCCGFVIHASRTALLSDARAYTIEELDRLEEDMYSYFFQASGSSPLVRRVMLQYGLAAKARAAGPDCQYLLQTAEGESLYNNSGIDAVAALKKAEDGDGLYRDCTLSLAGRDYCLAGITVDVGDESYLLAVVRDITEQMSQVRALTVRCIWICSGATLLSALLTGLFLTRSLRPMKELEQNAAAVMAGDYSRRMALNRRDELGTLARSFDRMSEAVAEQFQAVEAAAKERALLLSALTHEMRTPVTAITGYAYALKAARLNETQRLEAIDFIDSESRRLARLDETLTQLISLENKPLERTELDAGTLGKRLEQILRPQAEQYGLRLALRFDSGTLRGDGDLLVMLVTNLFDNARKAGAGEITVSLQDGVLSVSDNGAGIPQEQLELILQPFYQIDPSRNQEGFGLGLALCQKIARLHGSELETESILGKGSVFRVRLYNSFTTP